MGVCEFEVIRIDADSGINEVRYHPPFLSIFIIHEACFVES